MACGGAARGSKIPRRLPGVLRKKDGLILFPDPGSLFLTHMLCDEHVDPRRRQQRVQAGPPRRARDAPRRLVLGELATACASRSSRARLLRPSSGRRNWAGLAVGPSQPTGVPSDSWITASHPVGCGPSLSYVVSSRISPLLA